MDSNKKRQIITQTNDTCSNMISNVRLLKLSVLDLFGTLAKGDVKPSKIQQLQQQQQAAMSQHHNLSNHHYHPQYQQQKVSTQSNIDKLFHRQKASKVMNTHVLCNKSAPPNELHGSIEQQEHSDLILYINLMISSITGTIRHLEQDLGVLTQNFSLINTGETVHLGIDSSVDKHNLYMDLCLAYKNYSKLHDYSVSCHALLHQQSLKRVHKQAIPINPSLNSQQRTIESSIVATFNPYIHNKSNSFSRAHFTSVLENSLRKCEFMEGTYSQPFGVSTGIFQISVNRVLKAILLMRGMVIDAVIVKAYHESFAVIKPNRDGGYNLATINDISPRASGSQFVDPEKDDIDLWSESKYNVFRRLTHHANAAVLHFQYPTYPEIAVKSFLSWFNSYSDLFAATCSRCNTRLRKFMPPICRDFSSGFQPHHDSCK